MKVNRNELIVVFAPEQDKIQIFRSLEDGRRVLHTEYPLSRMLELSFSDAGQKLGEDLLLSIADLERLWTQ